MAQSSTGATIETGHTGAIHDAQLDYYGKLLATSAADHTIRVFDAGDPQGRCLAQLQGHEGPVWQLAWAHPKFGHIIASCSYDMKVIVWKEVNRGDWQMALKDESHQASVNSIAFGPWELGLLVAAGSSDEMVSVHTHKGGDQWHCRSFKAHPNGVNAVAWMPSTTSLGLATGGGDNQVRIWSYVTASDDWISSHQFQDGHSDWVRDLAWQPESGGGGHTLATCGADGLLLVWSQDSDSQPWRKKSVMKLGAPGWRVSWSVTGSMVCVSCGEASMQLFKENLDGQWIPVGSMDPQGLVADGAPPVATPPAGGPPPIT